MGTCRQAKGAWELLELEVELQLEAVASVCVCVFARSQVEENTGESIKRHLRILLAL